jgi:hydrogenase nickel incorporation protein HypA/HybF
LHELALAEAVIAASLKAAAEQGMSRIERIDVRIGELQRISREVFRFALQEVVPAADARLAETEITLEVEAARFCCRPCGNAFALSDAGGPGSEDEAEAIHFIPELAHSFLQCPACGSPDFEVTGGRGVSIERVEGS